MKTPEEFVKEYYQLPQSKIETVRIKSLIKCIERYNEYIFCLPPSNKEMKKNKKCPKCNSKKILRFGGIYECEECGLIWYKEW